MEGNSCWSKPILETRVFTKGRINFTTTLLAQDGHCRPRCRDGPAGVSREPSFGTPQARRGVEGTRGLAAATVLAGVCPVQSCRAAGGQIGTQRWRQPSSSTYGALVGSRILSLAGVPPILELGNSVSLFCLQDTCYHLENLCQRNERFCFFTET